MSNSSAISMSSAASSIALCAAASNSWAYRRNCSEAHEMGTRSPTENMDAAIGTAVASGLADMSDPQTV